MASSMRIVEIGDWNNFFGVVQGGTVLFSGTRKQCEAYTTAPTRYTVEAWGSYNGGRVCDTQNGATVASFQTQLQARQWLKREGLENRARTKLAKAAK